MNRILQRLDTPHERLLATIAAIEEESFSRRPAENNWSIAEVVHHLCLVEERVIKDLEKALSKPPRHQAFRRRLVPTAIVAYRLIRVKAPQAVTPTNPPHKEEAIHNFNAARTKLKDICHIHGRQRLNQTTFKHPFLGEINGVATISFVGYHEQRHYKQIREIIGKLNGSYK